MILAGRTGAGQRIAREHDDSSSCDGPALLTSAGGVWWRVPPHAAFRITRRSPAERSPPRPPARRHRLEPRPAGRQSLPQDPPVDGTLRITSLPVYFGVHGVSCDSLR